MRADPLRIRQVLFNLLSNAGKFTANGTVSLDVSRIRDNGGDWMHFKIADTGIGMTEEQSARLFQDFAQVDASTTRKYGGTGLGLAISRRFSEMMGGDIAVASRPGVGSVFTFRVPARIEAIARDVSRGAARPPSVAATSDEENNRVLVIDDDPDVRSLMYSRRQSAFRHEWNAKLRERLAPSGIFKTGWPGNTPGGRPARSAMLAATSVMLVGAVDTRRGPDAPLALTTSRGMNWRGRKPSRATIEARRGKSA